jgi:hypothetical protein
MTWKEERKERRTSLAQIFHFNHRPTAVINPLTPAPQCLLFLLRQIQRPLPSVADAAVVDAVFEDGTNEFANGGAVRGVEDLAVYGT